MKPKQAAEKTKKKAIKNSFRRQNEKGGPIPSLELFQKEDCPFSHAVRKKLSEMGLDFIAHTVPPGDALKRERLLRAGGKNQIPFLVDNRTGVRLYESSAIVAYLEKEYGRPAPTRVAQFGQLLSGRIESQADVLAWAIRNPMEKARTLAADFQQSLEAVRNSLNAVRSALGPSEQASGEMKSPPPLRRVI